MKKIDFVLKTNVGPFIPYKDFYWNRRFPQLVSMSFNDYFSDPSSSVSFSGAGTTAIASEELNRNSIVFEINKTGEDLSIAFNPNYLLDGLHAINAPYAQISFNTSSKAAILMGKPELNAPVVENFRYLLMPTKFAY